MLKLVNIKKNYEMKNQEPVKALRGVSVSDVMSLWQFLVLLDVVKQPY